MGSLEHFWNTFGTLLEQAWNIVGTIYIDFEGVTRIRGTSVEHWWNLGMDLGGVKKTPSRDGGLGYAFLLLFLSIN